MVLAVKSYGRLEGKSVIGDERLLWLINGWRPCLARTEVYSRVCGFFRPVQQWNKGKKEEFKDRVTFAAK